MQDICGTTFTKYSFRRMVSRLNTALDQYFQIARSVNAVRPIDDKNNTSIPLEQQNIASGTNSFKMNDFTNKMVGIIEVAVLDSDAVPLQLIPEYLHNLPGTFDELYGTYGQANSTGIPSYYCIIGDYIYIRPTPDYTEANGLQIYGNIASSKFDFLRFTVTQADPGVFTTASAHGMSVNDVVLFNTNGTIPTGVLADTPYYVVTVDATTTFEVALLLGGTAIEITANQATSEHMAINCSKVAGIAQIDDHFNYLARKASLPYLVEKNLPNKNDIASLIKEDEEMIEEYFMNKDSDVDNQITFKKRAYA